MDTGSDLHMPLQPSRISAFRVGTTAIYQRTAAFPPVNQPADKLTTRITHRFSDASSALCYALGSWGTQADQSQTKRRMLWILPAILVSFAAALIVVAIVSMAAGRLEWGPARLSVVRTVVNCALALSLAFLGSRWKHIELSWVAYAAVAFGTLKLLFEDLRFGNAASLVVSLLFYGLILILLPRLTPP